MAAITTTGRDRPNGNDRRRVAIMIPAAYPDPETWRRFPLFRRQLRRGERSREQPKGAAGERH
jgi:hypothetical protein